LWYGNPAKSHGQAPAGNPDVTEEK
jgi:hypothetical protein